jgi:serine protease Do
VELTDGRVFEGRVVARDSRQDLAAIMVRAQGLPSMSIRDVRSLRAGEVVIAVGNPMGAAGAVSVGIVHCAPGRQPCVIADIRLAPGNSGGPLADAQGRLVGINSMIVDGFGWAVPSNAVAAFLRTGRTVEWA